MDMDNSSTASNGFHDQTQEQNSYALKVLSQLAPIAVAITLTNGLVFVMFYRRKSLRTPSNYLLLSLSVCDFLTGTVNIPYFIIFSFNVIPYKSMSSYFMFVLQTLMSISAGYHILSITAEKYLAIVKPLRRHLLASSAILKLLMGVWMISAAFALIPFAWRTNPPLSICNIIYSAICLLMVFFIPYIFMVYAYTVMFRAISNREIPRIRNGITRAKLRKKNFNDKKCILVFATMAAIYAICWFPYFTIMLIINIQGYFMLDNLKSIETTIEAFSIIRFITSVINPLLYTFFKRDFWVALKTLLLRQLTILATAMRTKRTRSLPLCHNNYNGNQTVLHHRNVALVAFGRVNRAYTISEDQVMSTQTTI